ncbi:MAG TPA: hypothetical protein VII31_12325, partial [Caldimonas sp.]
MSRIAAPVHAGAALVLAATMGMLSACGGSDAVATPPESHATANALPSIQGARVSGRDEALRIVARGVVAPMYYSELAQAVLVRVFELRSRAPGAAPPAASGDRWKVALDAQPLGAGVLVEGQTGVEIEAADNA